MNEARDMINALTEHVTRVPSWQEDPSSLLRAMDQLTDAALALCEAMKEYALSMNYVGEDEE
jgi:hypothetical protein